MKSLFCFVLAFLICLVTAAPLLAGDTGHTSMRLLGEGPHYLNLALGAFEAFDDHDDTLAGQIELRCGKKLFKIGPLAGVQANLDGGVIGYAGIYLDLAVGHFVISPQTSIGAYEKGDSKDLGGTLEFLSGLDLSYQFAEGSRLGFRYEHISNGDLHRTNPGADILLLNYGIPF